jgi:hypothetical protein
MAGNGINLADQVIRNHITKEALEFHILSVPARQAISLFIM